jgi:CBS domain-containing protein
MTVHANLPPLLRISHRPPTCVSPSATVREATRRMVEDRVGAVAVVDGDRLVGIFTERDLMVRVVDRGSDPDSVLVADVMGRDPATLPPDGRRGAALDLMVSRHFRHVPITGPAGDVLGMLSIRDLLQHQLHRLSEHMDSLEAYVAADGPGG